jgi:tetratricopeptide (TPR) repeat protein
MPSLPVTYQLALLRVLNLRGREAIAAALANRLLVGHPAFTHLRTQAAHVDLDLTGLATRAVALQQMGSFYQLSGDTSQAFSLYDAAQATLDQWLAGLNLQRLNLQAITDQRGNAALIDSDQAARLAAGAGWLDEALGAVLISHPYPNSVMDLVASDVESAFLQLKRAALMNDRDPAVARDLARQCAADLLNHVINRGVPFNDEFIYSWHPRDAIQILLKLGIYDEALQLTLALLEVRPVDIALIGMAAKIHEQMGQIAPAIEYAAICATLDPQSAEWPRLLGSLWQKAGDWSRSYHAWETVLELSPVASQADRLSGAQAALKAENYDRTIQLCESVLVEEENSGQALGLIGQALSARGQTERAIPALVRATLLAPEILSPWLALAHIQQETGEVQRALETLRAAVTAVPEEPEGHLALAQACINAGLLADALPHLKKAYLLSSDNPHAVLLYGQVLRQLGHTLEARAVLDRARPFWMETPELAYEFARVLLDLDDPEGALPVLELALHNGLPVLDAHLLYARILLGESRISTETWDMNVASSRIQQADQALHRIIEVDPENLEARFLMADILREKGEMQEALEAYKALTELPACAANDLRWRIQWGLGRTALRLGENDIALAAIKEACQARPDSLQLQRALAEVSLRVNLPQEALEAADGVLKIAADDIENISWYAAFCAGMGEAGKAVEALERAVQIDPQRADLQVELAHWQISSGDLDAARATLEGLRDMEYVRRSDLRRAAQIFLRLEDPGAALECFERALKMEPDVPADMLFEVAQLYERLGDHEAALELAQRALDETPENLPVLLLQADLLAELKRPQAALALLERALRIAQSQGAQVREDTASSNEVEKLSDMVGEIHTRFAGLMLVEGNLPAALDHAEQALSFNPTRAARCYQAADLALALLQNERAVRIVRGFPVENPLNLFDQGKDGLNLFCLRVEMALGISPEEEVGIWIEEGLNRLPNEPRLLAARARWMAHQSEFTAARKWLEAARSALQNATRKIGSKGIGEEEFWLAEATIDVQDWRAALNCFERYVQANLSEARAHLGFARALVLTAERQRLCDVLGCRANTLGAEALDTAHQAKFEDATRAAGRLANAGEIGRWQSRGQAVFNPSAQNTRALAAMPAQAEDTAALIAALRLQNNRAAAAQVARRHPQHPYVLLQLALCYISGTNEEGLAIAEQAVKANPGQPLANVALAILLREANKPSRALEEYEAALTIWPNEPDWHDAAGDLCIQVGSIQAGILHRKQALAINPNHPRYAFKLGQACLADNEINTAISHLEKSCALDPNQPDVLLTLASAYHMGGLLPQAMEAAKQAAGLDPAASEGLLIASETALSMGQPELALEHARDAVRREPENPMAVLNLSNVLVTRGMSEEGLAVIENSSPVVKNAFPVAFERARLIHKLHGAQAAVETLEKLARDYPEEPGLLGYLAIVQAECGEFSTAERYAFKSLHLDPNQPDLTLMLGRLQRKSGQLDQAVHLLTEAIRMVSDNLECYLELGSVYQERREYTQALQVYRQAMHVAPGDYQAFYQSGLILRDSKDYPAAESMLRRAAELAPDNLTIRRQLVAVITLNLVHNKQEAPIS